MLAKVYGWNDYQAVIKTITSPLLCSSAVLVIDEQEYIGTFRIREGLGYLAEHEDEYEDFMLKLGVNRVLGDAGQLTVEVVFNKKKGEQ